MKRDKRDTVGKKQPRPKADEPAREPNAAGPSTAKPDQSVPELTEREKTVVGRYLERKAAAAPRLKVVDGKNGPRFVTTHPHDLTGHILLADALGTADLDFYEGLISQLGNAGSHGQNLDENGVNFMLSVVTGIKPRDQVEAMLAAQMAGIHMATMTMMRRLAHVENIPQQDSAERALNKLARTFATQMEALKRYRTGGEQKVTVQHVTVSEGGQAIVGNVNQAPRENAAEQVTKTAPQLTDAKQAPMTILGTEQDEGKPEPVAIPQERARSDGQSSA